MLHNDQINHVVLVVKPAVNLAVNSATPILCQYIHQPLLHCTYLTASLVTQCLYKSYFYTDSTTVAVAADVGY